MSASVTWNARTLAWFGRTVLNDVSHTRCAGEDVVAPAPRPQRAAGQKEGHRGLGGSGPCQQPDPHRKQLPDRQDLFRGVLHGGDDRNSDGAAFGRRQEPTRSSSTWCVFCGRRCRRSARRVPSTTSSHRRRADGGGVQAGTPRKPRCPCFCMTVTTACSSARVSPLCRGRTR